MLHILFLLHDCVGATITGTPYVYRCQGHVVWDWFQNVAEYMWPFIQIPDNTYTYFFVFFLSQHAWAVDAGSLGDTTHVMSSPCSSWTRGMLHVATVLSSSTVTNLSSFFFSISSRQHLHTVRYIRLHITAMRNYHPTRSAILCVFLAFCARLVSSFLLPQSTNVHANASRRRPFLTVGMNTEASRLRMVANGLNIDYHGNQDEDPRQVEFDISSDEPQSTNIRMDRFQSEKKNKEQFIPYGNELWELRSELSLASKELFEKMATSENKDLIQGIRNKIRSLEQRDANIVYGVELDAMDDALEEGREHDAEMHKRNAMNARDQLVQFQYEVSEMRRFLPKCL